METERCCALYQTHKIMERMKMQSLDMTGSNIDKIALLFPQCVTEHKDKDGKTVLGIDFEKLRDELSADVIDEGEERYQFTWPDKKAHAHLANTPTTKTLRPCREAQEAVLGPPHHRLPGRQDATGPPE